MNKFIGSGVVLALILGVAALLTGSKTVYVQQAAEPQVGAVSPYLPTPEINLGGLRIVGTEKGLVTGTSTVCAIQAPAATSTLISAGVKFTLASTSAVNMEFSNSSTQYATSTRIGSIYAVGASKQATIVASSTGSVAGDGTIFAPSAWFVGKFYDANNGTGDASTGRCWVTWAVPQ